MPDIRIRPLRPADRAAWESLWKGYQAFYKVDLGPVVANTTWRRFHDLAEPMHALGAFEGERLVGIVHYIFHRSCWTVELSVYLQDLFAVPDLRGKGVGRALIEAVADVARKAGSTRVHWLTHESNATARLLYDRIADNPGFMQYRMNIKP